MTVAGKLLETHTGLLITCTEGVEWAIVRSPAHDLKNLLQRRIP